MPPCLHFLPRLSDQRLIASPAEATPASDWRLWLGKPRSQRNARNQARSETGIAPRPTRVLLRAQKLHVCGSGTFGAFEGGGDSYPLGIFGSADQEASVMRAIRPDQKLTRRHQTCHFRKHATYEPAEFGGEIHKSHEIEPVPRSFCRRRSCTFAEVARLVPSGLT